MLCWRRVEATHLWEHICKYNKRTFVKLIRRKGQKYIVIQSSLYHPEYSVLNRCSKLSQKGYANQTGSVVQQAACEPNLVRSQPLFCNAVLLAFLALVNLFSSGKSAVLRKQNWLKQIGCAAVCAISLQEQSLQHWFFQYRLNMAPTERSKSKWKEQGNLALLDLISQAG